MQAKAASSQEETEEEPSTYAKRRATIPARDKPTPALSEEAAPVWIAGAEVVAGGAGGATLDDLEAATVLVLVLVRVFVKVELGVGYGAGAEDAGGAEETTGAEDSGGAGLL